MSKLRVSAHPLRIETGRYCKPPLPPDQRICQYCTLGAVENEEHFLLECTLYETKRRDLWQAVCSIFPEAAHLTSTQKFNLLLSLNNGDTELLDPVLKFVTLCFDKRAQVSN